MKYMALLLISSTLLFGENIEDKLNTLGDNVYVDNGNKIEKPKLTKGQKIDLLAKTGNPAAQNYLGYKNGTGKDKNVKVAFQWYMKAAKQHYGPAEYNVGMFYLLGIAVKKNPYDAYYWLRRGYDNGYTQAKSKLDLLCKEEDICGGR